MGRNFAIKANKGFGAGPRKCPRCQGEGKIIQPKAYTSFFGHTNRILCPMCLGKRKIR